MFSFLENRIAQVVTGALTVVGAGAVMSVLADWLLEVDFTPEQKQTLQAIEEYLKNRWNYIKKSNPENTHESHLTEWVSDVQNTITIAKAGNPEMVNEIDKIYNTVKDQLV